MSGYRIGVDIGGTNLRIGAAGADGALTHFRKLPRAQVLPGDAPCERLGTFLADCIAALGAVEAIGIGVPATVSADRRTILQAPNLPGLDGVALADALEAQLGIPVRMERDVNLLLAHDMDAMQLPRAGLCAGIYFGTGIGNALMLDGRPYGGRSGVAGELGHLPVIGGTAVCGCGNVGCTECYASGRALERIGAESFPDTPIAELFARHGDAPELVRFVDDMACVAAAEINLLDPEATVIGGGVPSMAGFPYDRLMERIAARLRKPLPAANCAIYRSADRPENGVLGGIRLAGVRSDCE